MNKYHAFAEMPDRQLPVNFQAEQAILGAIFANNNAYQYVSGFLKPEHFADPVNGRIYEAAARRIEEGKLADAVTLKADFENAGVLDEVGGVEYLTNLLTAMIGIINAGDYGRVVYDCWTRRQLIDLGEEVVNSAYSSYNRKGDPETAAELIERVSVKASELSLGGDSGDDGDTFGGAAAAAFMEGEAAFKGEGGYSISTGILSLDRAISRLQMDKLIVLGGRISMGKSALARTVALNAALGIGVGPDGRNYDDQERGVGVAYFALEEGRIDYGAAGLSFLTGIPIGEIKSGSAYGDPRKCMALHKAQLRLQEANKRTRVYSKAGQSLSSIRNKARRLQTMWKGELRLVVVDFMQLMRDPPGVREKRLAVTENAYGLKDLAKELGVAVIGLSQLSRAVEGRPDHRPTLADLKESGGIEEAANQVWFPYREAWYKLQSRPKFDGTTTPAFYQQRLREWQNEYDVLAPLAEVNIAKNKEGPAGVVLDLRYKAERLAFEDPPMTPSSGANTNG